MRAREPRPGDPPADGRGLCGAQARAGRKSRDRDRTSQPTPWSPRAPAQSRRPSLKV